MTSFFVTRIRLLLPLLVLSFSLYSRNTNAKVASLEKIFYLIGNTEVKVSDTFKFNAIIDSLQKEANIEKLEYAKLFVFLQKKKLYKDYTAYFYSHAPAFATFKTPAVKSSFKFYFGECLFDEREQSTGIQYMLEAKSEMESIGYEKIPAIDLMFYFLSEHYYHFKNDRKSIEYAALVEKFRSRNVTIGSYNTMGMAYQKLGLYDSAIIKFKQAIAKANADNIPVWNAIASGNLGRTYCLQKNYIVGISFLRIDAMASQYEPVNSALSALYIAEAYTEQRFADSAKYYIGLSRKIVMDEGLWNSGKFFLSRFCFYYYIQQALLNKLTGHFETAYEYLDTANINKEKYESQFDLELLTSAEKRVQGLEYQKNISLLDAQKKNERLQKIILFVVLTAVVIIAFLLQNAQKMKRRREQQLAAEKEANLLLTKQRAEEDLINARQQLDELVAQLQEKSSLKENLAADLADVSKSNQVNLTKEQANKIINDLTSASLLTNRDWQLFQQRFERVYTNFFSSLSREVPGITPAEERILALLKLKVSYRQMAQMLGISPESVRTAKYRLRKKLLSNNQPELLLYLED